MGRTTLKCTMLLLALVLIVCGERWIVEAQNAAQDKSNPVIEKLSPADIMRARADAREKSNAPLRQAQTKVTELISLTQQVKSLRSRLSFFLTAAISHRGIAGFMVDKTSGAKITFTSKRVGDHLKARIMNQNGVILIEYAEAERAPVAHPLTGETRPNPCRRCGLTASSMKRCMDLSRMRWVNLPPHRTVN